MLKHTTLAVTVAALLATSAAAQSADTVVATVGDTQITLGEMIIARARLPQQYSQFPDEVLFGGILDQLIQQQIFADALEDVPARVDYAVANERRSLMAGEMISALTEQYVTEEAIQEAYNARFDGAEPVTEWNASHLLVETEEAAAAARERIAGGEEFADVAREVSTGPSGPNGGQLGWFGPGQMVAEFEETVKSMEPGDLSEPVQTQFGWHIVILNDTRLQEQPGLDQVREELVTQIQDEAITAWLEEKRAATDVVMPEEGAFDPALIGNLDLLEPASE